MVRAVDTKRVVEPKGFEPVEARKQVLPEVAKGGAFAVDVPKGPAKTDPSGAGIVSLCTASAGGTSQLGKLRETSFRRYVASAASALPKGYRERFMTELDELREEHKHFGIESDLTKVN